MRHATSVLANDAWRFHLGELPTGEPPARAADCADHAGWASVTLPHSWNALDTMETDPALHYTRSAGWYVREFARPAAGQRLWVEIEAAAQRARAWLDGRPLGAHAGGYTAFTLELSPQLERHSKAAGGPPTLALRVDNLPDRDLIPSDLSDFFLYGGLTRNVHSYLTGPRRIAALRCETETTSEAATLTLRGRLDSPPPRPLTLDVRVSSPSGEPVLEAHETLRAADFALPVGVICEPALWSPDSPWLYTLRATLRDGEEVWDSIEERIGLRFAAFPAGGPFLLNGQPLRLHGTHRHEDWAGRAAAVPDELTRRELALVKQAGFNFIRLAHYPQAPAALEACDELGLVVWEELPWCRGGIGGEPFRAQTRAMLDEMIEQHFNHPTIVFWGLGNELDWESEHPDSSDERVVAFLGELHARAKATDPQRFTALRRFEPGARVVDVYSPSIWSGWYAGRYQDYEAALDTALARYPRLLHVEWGGDSHRGRHAVGDHVATEIGQESDHAEQPGVATNAAGPARASRDGDWSESYMLDLMEWHLQVQLRSRLPGNTQWVFKDFGTPLRPENPIPYVNQKGLLDRAGRPKDVYYLFQSYLSSAPMCYVESPTWPVRVGPAGEPQRVRVYSNCDRVTLFVNGVSAGERVRSPAEFPAAGLVWWVPLRAGENDLLAVGIAADGREVSHSVRQEYVEAVPGGGEVGGVGSALVWQITPEVPGGLDEPDDVADGARALRVAVQLVDARGRPALADQRRRVTFQLQGGGRLVDRLGTVGGSRVVELASGRASIVVIPAMGETATVTVSAHGIAPITIHVASVPSEAESLSVRLKN